MQNPYEDILSLPHHVSPTRPAMSMQDRAAQFSPFSALTGYDSAIKETARLTDIKADLDEYERSRLDAKLQVILEHLGEDFEVIITYFLPDRKKNGGSYTDFVGVVKKIDEYEHILLTRNGKQIPIDDIVEIRIDEQWDF
ncbi:MAG: YolD-like family protein [Fusicatenibacter sp.]|nr:YolD-like family protein [Fusicatenibacter sp.]